MKIGEREPVPSNAGEQSVANDGTDKQRFREEEWWQKRGYLLSREVEKLVKVNQVAKAIGLVIREFTAVAIVHDRDQHRATPVKGERVMVTKHDANGRIVEFIKVPYHIEKARVRVKAVQQVIT